MQGLQFQNLPHSDNSQALRQGLCVLLALSAARNKRGESRSLNTHPVLEITQFILRVGLCRSFREDIRTQTAGRLPSPSPHEGHSPRSKPGAHPREARPDPQTRNESILKTATCFHRVTVFVRWAECLCPHPRPKFTC